MESDSWSRFAAAASASKRHHHHLHPSSHHSRYGEASESAALSRDPSLRGWRDLFSGFEEIDAGASLEDESRPEFPCPFCAEDFDMVGLCCHIDDEHPMEARNGVCPICTAMVGLDLVGHMMAQHGNHFKMQRRRRSRKGSSASHTMFSLLKKDLREGNLQALLGGSSLMAPATAAPDPLLSSLIYTLPISETSKDAKPESLDGGRLINTTLNQKALERNVPSLSDKDQKERALRSEFVQDLVLSTIFDDYL